MTSGKERRRDRRRRVQLDALIKGERLLKGERLRIVDISSGGVGGKIPVSLVEDFASLVGHPVPLTLELPSGKSEFFSIQLTRLSRVRGNFGARFLSLSDEQFSIVERLFMGRPV